MEEYLSDRIKNLHESATLAMAAKAREFKAKGIDVISLSLGEPDFKTPKHIQEGAKEAIDSEKYFAYPPVAGYQDLREAIVEKFRKENNISYTPDQIVVSNGAKQSIANVMFSILNPKDEVVVFSPYWVSYSAIIQLAEGIPVYIKGGLENDFKVTAEQLEKAITPATKAIIYSSPCNPTGSVFTEKELRSIAKVLEKHPKIVVVADEIYEHINYTDKHFSIASIPEMQDRTATINGMAKGFAMTGWRVGYLGAPTWLAKACIKMQGQITSANSSIAQRATYTALTTDITPTIEMSKQYLKRRDMMYELLKEIPGIEVNLPLGAFYFFPKVNSYFGKSYNGRVITDAEELSMYLLEEAHVSVVAGDAFGDGDCIRISYAASEQELRIAIERIKKALANLQ